jgi:hypothetical protein
MPMEALAMLYDRIETESFGTLPFHTVCQTTCPQGLDQRNALSGKQNAEGNPL